MIKGFVLAALLGFAYSSGWEEGDNLLDNEWFTVDWMANIDAGYGTHWYIMPAEEGSNPYETEKYGAHLYTTASLTLVGTLFKARQHAIEFEVVPLWFAPYEQEIMYSRVQDDATGNNFYMQAAGTRTLKMLDYTTTYTRNTKTVKVSIVDYLEDDRSEIMAQDADWSFNPDYEEEWEDSYWTGNFLNDLDSDIVAESWYGSQDYYREWITDSP